MFYTFEENRSLYPGDVVIKELAVHRFHCTQFFLITYSSFIWVHCVIFLNSISVGCWFFSRSHTWTDKTHLCGH